MYGRAVRELANEGALAVGFDVMFYDLRPDHQPVVRSDGKKIGSDEFLAREIQGLGKVILAANQDAIPPELFRTNAWNIGDVSTEKDVDAILRRARAFLDYRVWHPALIDHARAVDFQLDKAIISSKSVRFPLRDGGDFELARNPDGTIDLEEITGERGAGRAAPFRFE